MGQWPAGATAESLAASETRYWILLSFGVISAIVGFAIDRRKPKSET